MSSLILFSDWLGLYGQRLYLFSKVFSKNALIYESGDEGLIVLGSAQGFNRGCWTRVHHDMLGNDGQKAAAQRGWTDGRTDRQTQRFLHEETHAGTDFHRTNNIPPDIARPPGSPWVVVGPERRRREGKQKRG